MNNDTPEFPAFVHEAQAQERCRAISEHLRGLENAWPEWRLEVGGRCEVGRPIVHSITHGEQRYRYMAPCIIRQISEDFETFTVEIDYPVGAGNDCDKRYNGEILRLDITELWAPVALLREARSKHGLSRLPQ